MRRRGTIGGDIVETVNSQSGEPVLRAKRLSKWFGELQVLRDVDVEAQRGDVLVIIGPSGSGKSPFLRCLNYLEPFQEGEVEVLGERFVGTRQQTAKEVAALAEQLRWVRQRIGMVFQGLNLFPHLTVLDNITVGPTTVVACRKPRPKPRRARRPRAPPTPPRS
jgi:ABC-type polar amino acid transport system ATPase subunit